MRVADFNFFDWFLILITAFSMIMAFRTGLVRAIFGLLGLIAGFQLAAWYYADVSEWVMAARIKMSVPTARIIAFVLIAIIVTVIVDLAGRFIQKILRQMGLGWFDRLLGMAFGFARGCLIAIAILMLTSAFAPQSAALTDSELTPYLFAVAHDVSFLVPQYLQTLMVDGAIDLKHGPAHWINRH
jgi:membrane protein required for colicin V production